MRLRRLDLLRYGRFTGELLDLPLPDRQPDFHIVFGLNEAGKSTALLAIEDLLFGIHPNSRLDFLHAYPDMRIGAVLQNDHETLEVRRRKGNRDTLLTPEETPIPMGEGALTPFLAGANRSFIKRMFSLDHERLREGGREIIEAQDDIGKMLFSAGAGLSGLRETLNALEQEADALWAPRRAARRKYYQADDRLKEARKTLREHTVTVADWRKLEQAVEAVQETYAALEQEIEEKSAEQRKLGRIRRVYGSVRRNSELEEGIAALGEVTLLREDALQILRDAERNDAATAGRIETLRNQIDSARDERSKLTYDEGIIAHENDIEQLHEQRITARSAKADLPALRAELARAEADLRRLAADLEWDADDVELTIGRIPPRPKVNIARTLLNRRGERLSAVQNAKAATEEAAVRACELLRDAPKGEPVDVSSLAAVTRAARRLGDMAARISAATAQVDDEQASLDQRLESLKPAVADETTLGALTVPSQDTVLTYRDSSRALNERLQSCRKRIQDTGRELGRLRNSTERFVHDEDVASTGDLVRARKHRDDGWSLIRRLHVDSAPVADDESSAFLAGTEGNLPDAYEEAVRIADTLADRRFDKAEAVAQLAVMLRGIAEQEELVKSLGQDERTLGEERRRLDAAWRDMWSEAPFEPLAPDDMLEWLSIRKDARSAVERRAKAERQVAGLRRQEAESRAGVLDALTALGAGAPSLASQPLAVVLETADEVLAEHEKVADSRRRSTQAHRQAAADEENKRKALEKAEATWSEWQGRWADALTALGLDPTADPEAVSAQIDVIDEMRAGVDEVNRLRHERIGKIEGYLAAFGRDVAQLAAIVAPDLIRFESEEKALQMERRLIEAKRVRDLLREKDHTIAGLKREIDECEAARRHAREDVHRLQEAAGVTNAEQLKGAIDKSDRLRALKAEQAQVLGTLREAGDGLSVDVLQEECKEVDPDQVTAREASLAQELEDLHERRLEAREHRTAARQAFEAVGGAGDDKAARAAADQQEALAEMQDIAEQYVRARSAALLLQWAIDRYRLAKQAPLLESAGQLFTTLTGGSFKNLRVDFDDHDQPHLIGQRPDGAKVAVPGMSTGTADQLYLALRIASVADYLDRAPPLPFIADDLFINFDDDRAAAGFQVLGQLAEKTQVLFFTHHQHLVDIASETLGESIPVVSLRDASSA